MGDIDKSFIEALSDDSKPQFTIVQAKAKLNALDKKSASYKDNKRNAKNDLNVAIAYATGKQLITVSGRNFFVKKSYLKKLKDPVKYMEGIYARSLRSEQKKAYKEKDYNSVVNIAKKLNRLKKDQGLTKYKITKSRNSVADNIEKKTGIKLDKESRQNLVRSIKADEKYTAIIVLDRKRIDIAYI